jgi:glycerophosphoryl diester phosphodiesterase
MANRPSRTRWSETIEDRFHRLVDRLYRRWPRPVPAPHRLARARIVSHRGEHDNRTRIENTLPAFDAAATAGVWGLEMDVRWTRDLVPVVFHDACTRRLFAEPAAICRLPHDTLRRRFPLIPDLAEVIERYGGGRHLMLEIKAEPYPQPGFQSRRLRASLKHLTPAVDFHLMSLDPGMFDPFDFLPAEAFVPIARLRVDRISRMAARRGWAGLAGHFLVATRRIVRRHHRLGQQIGTGFADSPRCLYREVARGVDWIFSNRAVAMQALCKPTKTGEAIAG